MICEILIDSNPISINILFGILMVLLVMQIVIIYQIAGVKKSINNIGSAGAVSKGDDEDSRSMTNLAASNKSDDMEIAAAIMAAISAYSGIPESGLSIKSIKRVENKAGSWRNAGI